MPAARSTTRTGHWWITFLGIVLVGLAPSRSRAVLPARAQADQPAHFSGTVTIDGQRAGTLPGIGAQVGGSNCGSSVVNAGTYAIDVASASQKAGCGTPGATVVFVLLGAGPPGGEQALQTGTWDNTRPQRLDLTFITQAPAPSPTETVQLVQGCNNVALTWPTGTPTGQVARAVTPGAALVAIWRYNTTTQRFAAFAPAFPQASDLTTVNRLDAVFLCLAAPGTLTRPVV